MERIPACGRTREKLKALMEGRGEATDGRSELVRLAAGQGGVVDALVGMTVEPLSDLGGMHRGLRLHEVYPPFAQDTFRAFQVDDGLVDLGLLKATWIYLLQFIVDLARFQPFALGQHFQNVL